MLFGLKICNMCLPIGDTGEKTHIHPPQKNQTKIKNHKQKINPPSKQNQEQHTNLSGDFEIVEKKTSL